jgi:uncharacterized protein YaaQ
MTVGVVRLRIATEYAATTSFESAGRNTFIFGMERKLSIISIG